MLPTVASTATPAKGFFEDFSGTGGLNASTWLVARRQWGGVGKNGGVVPENVHFRGDGTVVLSVRRLLLVTAHPRVPKPPTCVAKPHRHAPRASPTPPCHTLSNWPIHAIFCLMGKFHLPGVLVHTQWQSSPMSNLKQILGSCLIEACSFIRSEMMRVG